MRRIRGFVSMLFVVLFVVSPLPRYTQAAEADDVGTLVDGLNTFSDLLGQFPALEQFSSVLPLTDLVPVGEQGLNLATLLNDSLTNALNGLSEQTYAALEAAISDASGTYDGISISFNTVHVGANGSDSSLIDVQFSITADYTATVPLAFSADPVELDGGALSVHLMLYTDLHFQLDTNGLTPATAFYLVGEPTVQVFANANATLGSFSATLGFTDITAGGTALLNTEIDAAFVDPDASGSLTVDEWIGTSLEDLLNITVVDRPGDDVSVDLALDAALIPGSLDATINFSDPSLANGFDIPALNIGDLIDFTTITASDVLGGLNQLVSSLMAAENISAPDLPFLQGALSDAFDFAQPLIDVLRNQGDAALLCGTQDTDPPLGLVTNVAAGTEIYCQAVSVAASSNVVWSIGNGTVDSNATSSETVGPNPSLNVKLTVTTAGRPDIELQFHDVNGDHTVTPRFETAQALFTKLIELAGIDANPANLVYDSDTNTLSYRIIKTFDAPGQQFPLDFGDQLQSTTNLIDLSATGAATATIDPANISLDVTFGIILIDDSSAFPGGEVADRFFVQVRNGADEFEFSADAALTANIDLEGRIGFVEVQAVGDAAANPSENAAFFIGPANAAQPLLGINIDAPAAGIPLAGRPNIANAVQVTQLLSEPLALIDPAVNMQMSAGLSVTASLGTPPLVAAGGRIGIDWPDVTNGTPTITTDTNFTNNLKVLDINPGVSGSHSGGNNAGTLTDSSKNFTQIAGLQGSLLRNTTDGSSCTISAVAATTLTCALAGGNENDWDTNDAYSVDGDPFALLVAILDNLDLLAQQIDAILGTNAATQALDTKLPLVGMSPNDLLEQFQNLRDVISQIRSGTPSTLLRCGTKNTTPPTGAIVALAEGSVIYCQAETKTRRVLDAEWRVNGGSMLTTFARPEQRQSSRLRGQHVQGRLYLPMLSSVSAGEPQDVTVLDTVSRNPSANVAFVIDDGDAKQREILTEQNFSINLRYLGSQGVQVASFPNIDVPTSLQELESTIETALGIPAEAFGLEMTDLPAPGSTTPNGVKDLVIRLGYGLCTDGYSECNASDVTQDAIEVPLQLDLGSGNPSLASLGTDGSFKLDYAAHAQLDLALALAPTFDENSVVVVDTSGIELAADVNADNVQLNANIGPLSIELGTAVDIDPVTDGVQAGFGTAKVGARFTVASDDNDATDNNQTFTISDFVSNLDAGFDGPSIPNDCGTFDENNDGNTTPDVSLVGDGCARLSMGLNNQYLGDLAFLIPDVTDPAGWEPYIPADLLDNIANALLDWSVLLSSLDYLLAQLQDTLEGGAADAEVPLIGDALDAGADVVAILRDQVIQPLQGLIAELDSLSMARGDQVMVPTVGAIKTKIQQFTFDTLNATGLLVNGPWGAGTDIEADDVRVLALCGSTPVTCNDADSATTLSDVRVSLFIGQGLGENGDAPVQGCEGDSCLDGIQVPFDLGLDGVPLSAEGALSVNAGWRLFIDFGLSRNDGPYLVAGGSDHTIPELQVGASVALGDAPAACLDDPFDPDTDPATLQNYSDQRCLNGTLGFLQVILRDGNDSTDATADEHDDRTSVQLLTKVDVVPETGDRLTLGQLIGGASLEFGAVADANVDLRVRTGISGQTAGFPSVLGAFHLAWSFDTETPNAETLALSFTDLHLDLGSFISDFLRPIVTEIQKITKPLQPVIDTLRAPLPVLSDLSRLVGGGDISLFSLLQVAVQANGGDLALVERILQLITFFNNLPTAGNFLIPLSSTRTAFEINPAGAKGPKLGPQDAGSLVTNDGGANSNLLDEIENNSLLNRGDGVNIVQSTNGAFGVDGLSFPFLDNASQIFRLLMGQDVTLVRYDAGKLEATAGLSYTFGPIFVGPVPISITLGGSVTVRGRFAMGYDTSGLRKVLAGGSGVHLFDGIFIDDLDEHGVDVPEISLIGTVSAGAALELVIVSAGVEGGIRLTVDLNLNDSPEPDGKLRIEEIVNKLRNPICLFDVSGRLEAFLAAFVRIGFSFLSVTFRIEIANIVLLEFSSSCSDVPPPDLAVVEDGNLRLLVGSAERRAARHVAEDEINESVVVRQLNTEGTKFSIAAFGVYEEETISAGGKILADSEDGKDNISLQAGVDTAGTTYQFTADAIINAGSDNDSIRTGNGNDLINGGSGSDKLNAGGGTDTVNGDGGTDIINGEDGTDTVHGGADDDVVMGGPGVDTLYGDAGNDSLTGGLGTNTPTQDGPNPDLGDTLVGGADHDDLDGGYGDDFLYGDDIIACEADGSGGGNDQLRGGFGADELVGGSGNDIMSGDQDDDTLCGNGGDDILEGDLPGAPGSSDGTLFKVRHAKARAPLTTGTNGNDTIFGGSGADELHGRGGHDDLFGLAGDDRLFGEDGNDDLSGGTEADIVSGGDGRDYLFGDDGKATRAPGQTDATSLTFSETLGSNDTLRGGLGDDVGYGEGGPDALHGDAGADVLSGNAGIDILRGGTENDTIFGNADDDQGFGDSGNDQIFGNTGNDVLRGSTGDDHIEGNQDTDTIQGDAGQDDLIGGSEVAGNADANDTINGNADQDVIAGDNATITRPGGSNSFDGSVVRVVTLLDPTIGGGDIINGDDANDRIFGGPANDIIHGNLGDDYAEGNQADDIMYGDLGQDDLIGGSAQAAVLDGTDRLFGGSGSGILASDFDVLAGDNATISRPLAGGLWITDSLAADVQAIRRTVTLLDVAEVGAPAPVGSGARDFLFGESGYDRLYGQAGNDDLTAGTGDDYAEGNAGADLIMGNAGQDDLLGGTGRTVSNDPASAHDGRLDGIDTIFGGDNGADLASDFDVIAGDNADIARPVSGGGWVRDTFAPQASNVVRRTISLFDVATATAPAGGGTSAGDILAGEASFDIIYGQGGDENAIDGGTGDDYIEGNAGNDRIYGNAGQDDLIGGTGRTVTTDPATALDGRLDGADFIYGGIDGPDITGDFDVILGDNGTLFRPLTAGAWRTNTFNTSVVREFFLYDVGIVTAAAAAGSSGGDSLFGEGNDDVMYGQGGDDAMSGGTGDDDMEGNAAVDTMSGGAGNDDMLGGTGRINTDGANGVDGRLDAGDILNGNDGFDVMAGDNALLVRVLVDGAWVPNGFNAGIQHERRILLDLDSANWASVSGSDQLYGDGEDDLIYGQGSDDYGYGGAGDDLLEGNHAADSLFGEDGQDDLVGGTTQANLLDTGDLISGGAGHDVLLGDNGTIERPLTANRQWIRDNFAANAALVVLRDIHMFDLDQAVGNHPAPTVSGGDRMFGDEDHDLIFGQSNGSQSATQNDPADGVDNDRDGATDEDAAWFGDEIHGGSGDDIIEGNHGNDWIFGDEQQDDILGGSSSGNGIYRSNAAPLNLADGDDVIRGGDHDDVVLGDHGTITRPLHFVGQWTRIIGGDANLDMVVRETTMVRVPEHDDGFGNDYIQGNAGNDDLYGQRGHDYIEGNADQDAVVGDLGQITNRLEDGSREAIIETNQPFLAETIFEAGSLTRLVELFEFDREHATGNDIILGGDNHDSLHSGPGDDFINGDGDTDIATTNDDDAVFGADGNDVLWGGRNNDHVYGGNGDDNLDVKPRPDRDPQPWFDFGGTDNYQGFDILYGGWDQDALQADLGGPGPVEGDRLLDWVGAYNVYYTCPGAYGEGVITRSHSPSVIRFIQDLAEGDGAFEVRRKPDSGYNEVAMVFAKDARFNSHPTHPDHPGHFTCN